MSRITLVFLTIFFDLIGFGIVLPLLPFYAGDFGASPVVVGLLVGIHPAIQFVTAPIWGRLSDHHGRRPILLVGLLGSSLSYLVFGLATNLTWLFASRIIAGAVGANVPVTQAYIADNTGAEDRTRGMGLVGAAFGLAFVVGPAAGGALSHFGYSTAGFAAAALSLLNACAAFFFLPESREPETEAALVAPQARRLADRLRLILRFARHPALRYVLGLVFVVTFIFSGLTTVFPLFIESELGWGPRHAGYLLAYLGLIMAAVQGRLIGPLAARFGERPLVLCGALFLVVGYGALPISGGLAAALFALALIGVGTALDWPSLQGLASRYAAVDVQGAILGVTQSVSGLARVTGAVWAGWVFGLWSPEAPFALSSAIASLAAVLALWFMIRTPEPADRATGET